MPPGPWAPQRSAKAQQAAPAQAEAGAAPALLVLPQGACRPGEGRTVPARNHGRGSPGRHRPRLPAKQVAPRGHRRAASVPRHLGESPARRQQQRRGAAPAQRARSPGPVRKHQPAAPARIRPLCRPNSGIRADPQPAQLEQLTKRARPGTGSARSIPGQHRRRVVIDQGTRQPGTRQLVALTPRGIKQARYSVRNRPGALRAGLMCSPSSHPGQGGSSVCYRTCLDTSALVSAPGGQGRSRQKACQRAAATAARRMARALRGGQQ